LLPVYKITLYHIFIAYHFLSPALLTGDQSLISDIQYVLVS
jgi:hypothetical protein